MSKSYFSFSFGSRGSSYDANSSPRILFSEPDDQESSNLIDYLNSPKNPKFMYLLNPSYNFDIFNQMEKLFTITTNNGSYKFNIEILKETSATINNLLKSNPDILEFHLDIADKKNVMLKIEQLYSGQKILINEDEIPFLNQIVYELNINSFSLRGGLSFRLIETRNSFISKGSYKIKLNHFYSFLKEKIPKTFTIVTKSKEYKCNMIGIKSSSIINEQLKKNPSLDRFEYDYDDEFGEFQSICDFFNFNFVPLTTDNMSTLKMIAEDLQIDLVLEDIDNFIDDYDKRVQTVDDQQLIIDSINNLFDILYKIKVITVESAKNRIIDSSWCKTAENVQELAAFILQVIQTDFLIQPYIIELIELLNKEANESNELSILVPFLVSKLMLSFESNKLISSFIYIMHKKGFISKEDIMISLKKFIKSAPNDYSNCFIFLPELLEILKFESNKITSKFPHNSQYIQSCIQDIDKFKKMRDSFEPDDPITKALIYDDVNTLQSIIVTNQINLVNAIVPYNIFDYFAPCGNINYINYAACYGSIKCFKYLLLNHAKIDKSTFSYAVFGGNVEIVKIVDQTKIDTEQNNEARRDHESRVFRFRFEYSNEGDFDFNLIIPAIKKHENNLFDWILDHKFPKIIEKKESIARLMIIASKNGNSHSIINIIDKGFDFGVLDRDSCKSIISNASTNGFYKLLKFLAIVMKKKLDQYESLNELFDSNSAVFFGNVSIFNFYYKKVDNIDLENALLISVEQQNKNIIRYILNNLYEDKLKNNKKLSSIVYQMFTQSIEVTKNDIFDFLIDEFTKIDLDQLYQLNKVNLLSKACYSNKVEISKKITNLILEQKKNDDSQNVNFTLPFYNAIYSGSAELCQFFVDNKVFIDFKLISLQIDQIKNVKKDVFNIIINNITPDAKEVFDRFYLNEVIRSRNKIFIEYILKDNIPNENSLFEAVKTGDIDIVNMVLNKNSKPSFINKLSNEGTVLNVAIIANNINIVKRLLSLPGIDLNLYDENKKTPLMTAIYKLNIEIMNEILSHFQNDNKLQMKQINEATKTFLQLVASKDRNERSSIVELITILNKLVEYDFIDVNEYYSDYSIFSFACETNQIEIVKKLLDSNRVNVNSYSLSKGNTPLLHSIDYNKMEIAKLLIDYKDTNINHRNFQNQTALLYAADRKLVDLVKIIINNEKFDPDESRLNYAFYRSNIDICKILITVKDLDINYKIRNENSNFLRSSSHNRQMITLECNNELDLYTTPFVNAVRRSLIEKMDLIVKHPSFDPVKSLVNKAVFISCENGDIEIFRKMMEITNNDINIVDDLGKSLLEVALSNNQQQIVLEILNNEKIDLKNIDFPKIFTNRISYRYTSDNTISQLIEFDKEHGNLIDFKSLLPNGKSFFTAISPQNIQGDKLIELFIKNGADPNLPDKFGVYPLQYAIKLSRLDFVTSLIRSNKIDLSVQVDSSTETQSDFMFVFKSKSNDENQSNQLINKKMSYLHLAIESNDTNIASYFIQNNLIDINVTDSSGDTPLMKACRNRNIEIIELLFKMDDLDYSHKNNVGDDALSIVRKLCEKKDDKVPNSKDQYLKWLMSMLKPKSGFTFNFG